MPDSRPAATAMRTPGQKLHSSSYLSVEKKVGPQNLWLYHSFEQIDVG